MKIGNYKLKIVLVTLLLFLWSNEASAAFRISRPPYLLGLTSGLVGHWTFDGNKMLTNVGDSSGQGNNGSLIGQAATTTVPGKVGQALSFDGVDDSVRIGIDEIGSAINGSAAVTFSSWINYGTLTGGQYDNDIFVAWANDPGSFVWINVRNDVGNIGKLLIGGRSQTGDSFQETTSASALTSGKWHHVIGVLNFTNDTITIYVDSIESINTSVSFGSNTYVNGSKTTESDTIGVNGTTGNRYFPGKIDDVRIYNRALSQAEITALYTATKGEKISTTNTSSTANGNALASGLVGHWTFDGKDTPWTSSSAATTLDKSGSGNTGTLTNMSQSLAPVAGKVGQALNFDGSDDYVSVPYTASLAPSTAVSGGGWFKAMSKTANNQSIFSKTEAGGYNIYLNNTGGACGSTTSICGLVNVGGSYYNVDYAVSNISNNVWYHVFITYDNETLRLYLDGVLIDSDTSPSGNISYTSTNNLCIGSEPSDVTCSTNSPASNFFNGSLDDVRIYNRALSQAEITALYTATKGQKVSTTNTNSVANGNPLAQGLVGHWTFDGPNMLTNVKDSSGQGNNGSLVGQAATTTVPGKVGQALSFDGVDDYVDLGSSAPLSATSPFTILWWEKVTSIAGTYPDRFRFNVTGGGSNDFLVERGDAAGFKAINFASLNGNYIVAANAPTIANSVGIWRHWVIVGLTNAASHTASDYQVYVDGISYTTSSPGSYGGLSDLGSRIGYFGADDPTNASLDDVRIYNRALSSSEVLQLYNLGR